MAVTKPGYTAFPGTATFARLLDHTRCRAHPVFSEQAGAIPNLIMKTDVIVRLTIVMIAFAQTTFTTPAAEVGEAIADKTGPTIAKLCPGAVVSGRGGELSVKLLTYTTKRHHTTLQTGEVVPGEFVEELPEAVGFFIRLAIRPGPYFAPRALELAPEFEGGEDKANGVYHTAAAVEFPKADYTYMVAQHLAGGRLRYQAR